MFPRLRAARRAASRATSSVVIIGHARRGDCEGVIDQVRYRGGQGSIEARLVLSDGRAAVARMDTDDWDWLDLRVGDIVSVISPSDAVRVNA